MGMLPSSQPTSLNPSLPTRLRALLRNRWLGFVAATWIEACSGCGYMFGLYSQSLKLKLGYNQRMVDSLGLAKDLGGNVGIISGFVGDCFPTWVTLLIGALQNCFGYGMLWLVLTGRTSVPSFWHMCAYIAVGTNGATFFNTAALVTNVRNFPGNRGPVVGLLKGYIGLSGAIFSQVYLALYAPHTDSFLFMAAWLPSLVAMLTAPLVHPLPVQPWQPQEAEGAEGAEAGEARDREEDSNLLVAMAAGITLAVYLLAASLAGGGGAGTPVSVALALGALAILAMPAGLICCGKSTRAWLSARTSGGANRRGPAVPVASPALPPPPPPVLAPVEASSSSSASSSSASASSSASPTLKLRGRASAATDSQHLWGSKGSEEREHGEEAGEPSEDAPLLPDKSGALPRGKPCRGEDHHLGQAACTLDFWLIYAAMTLASGSGLTAINNLGQVGRSLGYSADYVATLVSLMSVWNFLGRVGAGFLSELCVRQAGAPRPVVMAATQALMAVGHLAFATALPGSLHVGSALVGLSYGAQWGVMPAVASELFGLKYFSSMYNWLTITNPTGSYLLSVCVAGYLYDVEAEKEGGGKGGKEKGGGILLCHGSHCFRLTFVIMAAACLLACAASCVLSAVSRPYYAAEYAKQKGRKGGGGGDDREVEEEDEGDGYGSVGKA